MANDDEYIDSLTDKELEELTDPDDNPDEADVDASARSVNIAALICGITAAVLTAGAAIWLYFYLRDKHEECTFSRDVRHLKGDVQRIATQADPRQIVHNREVRKAMSVLSDHVRDLPGDVHDAAARVRDAIAD